MIFLDANYVLRYLVQPDSPQTQAMHEAAAALFEAAERRAEALATSEAVLAEVAYVLAAKRHYGLSPAEIAARLRRYPESRRAWRTLR